MAGEASGMEALGRRRDDAAGNGERTGGALGGGAALKGRPVGVELVVGAVAEWCGRGLLNGLGRLLDLGAGSARGSGVCFETETLGIRGVGSEIEGMEETLIEGTGKLLVETGGGSSMRTSGVPEH